MNASNAWAWWQAALKGAAQPVHENEPMQGFYRVGDDAVAIWHDAGEVLALRAGRPTSASEIWTWACRKPISHSLYTDVMAGGQWPEKIDAEVAAAKPAEPAIGHNSGLPHEEVLDELAAIEAAFAAWLKSIGSISTEEHDAKAETFKSRLGALQKKADGIRDGQKRPHLEAGREIDALWKPIVNRADEAKRTVGAAATPYRQAREAARLKAEREAREAADKAAREAAAAGLPPEPPAAPAEPPRPVKTGLRTVKTLVLSDPTAAVTEILRIAPDQRDILDAIRVAARRLIEAGTPVPGASIITERKA
jgi:hypothetical protein